MVAGVVGAPELALVLGLAHDVHDLRVARRHRDADAIHVVLGQSALAILARQPLPRRAAVRRAIDGRVAAARLEVPRPSAIRVHPGVEDVGVARIGRDVGAGGLRIDEENPLPALAAVGRLEDAAFLVRAPLAPEATGVHELRIPGVDHDARDPLALIEPDVRPMLTGVDRLVHTVADRRIVSRILFARTHVDDVRVARCDRDRPDGTHRLLVEYRLEGDAAVDGLDDAAVRAGDVVHVAVSRYAGHDGDPARG